MTGWTQAWLMLVFLIEHHRYVLIILGMWVPTTGPHESLFITTSPATIKRARVGDAFSPDLVNWGFVRTGQSLTRSTHHSCHFAPGKVEQCYHGEMTDPGATSP